MGKNCGFGFLTIVLGVLTQAHAQLSNPTTKTIEVSSDSRDIQAVSAKGLKFDFQTGVYQLELFADAGAALRNDGTHWDRLCVERLDASGYPWSTARLASQATMNLDGNATYRVSKYCNVRYRERDANVFLIRVVASEKLEAQVSELLALDARCNFDGLGNGSSKTEMIVNVAGEPTNTNKWRAKFRASFKGAKGRPCGLPYFFPNTFASDWAEVEMENDGSYRFFLAAVIPNSPYQAHPTSRESYVMSARFAVSINPSRNEIFVSSFRFGTEMYFNGNTRSSGMMELVPNQNPTYPRMFRY